MKKLSAANDSRRRTAIELLNYSRNEQTPNPERTLTPRKKLRNLSTPSSAVATRSLREPPRAR